MSTQQNTKMAPGLVLLMAIATGMTVASNYYAQPLLHTISINLALSIPQAGLVVTAAQVSYGLGLILLVPLGDILERRNLIFVMTLLSAAGLLISALSTNLPVLLLGTAMSGLFAVAAQILIPFAATLASPAERGKVVGTIFGGLLMGILLARTAAGLFAVLGTWRAVYWFASGMMVILAFILRRALPRRPPEAGLGYLPLIASILHLLVHEPVLRSRALLGACTFGCFGLMWTSMAFLLASPPFNYSDVTIGLFGLAGAAGALAASRVGKMADRGKGDLATWIGLGLLLVSWLPLAFGRSSVILLIVGVVLLDLAAQVVQISCQSALYRVRPEARSRMTAGYMTLYFMGGSAGSLLSAHSYARYGWMGVVWAGVALTCVGIALWTVQRKAGAVPD